MASVYVFNGTKYSSMEEVRAANPTLGQVRPESKFGGDGMGHGGGNSRSQPVANMSRLPELAVGRARERRGSPGSPRRYNVSTRHEAVHPDAVAVHRVHPDNRFGPHSSTFTPDDMFGPQKGKGKGNVFMPADMFGPQKGKGKGSDFTPGDMFGPEKGKGKGSVFTPDDMLGPQKGQGKGIAFTPDDMFGPQKGKGKGNAFTPDGMFGPTEFDFPHVEHRHDHRFQPYNRQPADVDNHDHRKGKGKGNTHRDPRQRVNGHAHHGYAQRVEVDLPKSNWVEVKHDQSGESYWLNQTTNETTGLGEPRPAR